MQYWRFLLLPNLRPVSRYQLVLAILMFIGSPAWIGLLVARHDRARTVRRSRHDHARRCRQCVAGVGARDVVLAEDRGRARRPAVAGGAPRIRRRGPVHRQFRHRNDVLDHAVSDPLDQPHDLSLRPAVQPRDQLDGAGPRRSRGAFDAGVAGSLAADPAGMRLARPRAGEPAVGNAVHFPAGRRAGLVGSRLR